MAICGMKIEFDISLQRPFISHTWKTPSNIEHVMSKWNYEKN
jgi:hypothetical protein